MKRKKKSLAAIKRSEQLAELAIDIRTYRKLYMDEKYRHDYTWAWYVRGFIKGARTAGLIGYSQEHILTEWVRLQWYEQRCKKQDVEVAR